MKRRIILNGQGYGFADVRLNVTVDGETVFQGTIPTLDEPVPPLPFNDMDSGEIGSEVASWDVDIDFTGTQQLTIDVESGTFLLTGILSTHSIMPNPESPPAMISSGQQAWPCPPEVLSNVVINNISSTMTGREEEYSGQWIWRITSGSSFRSDINLSPGKECNEWSPSREYKKADQVTHLGKIYMASGYRDPIPAGTPLDDIRFWKALPYEDWDQTKTYSIFSRVRYQECQYTAEADIPANTPITDIRWTNHTRLT